MKYCSSLVFLLSVGLESLEILLLLGFFWFFNSDKRQRKCTPRVPRFVYIYIYLIKSLYIYIYIDIPYRVPIYLSSPKRRNSRRRSVARVLPR